MSSAFRATIFAVLFAGLVLSGCTEDGQSAPPQVRKISTQAPTEFASVLDGRTDAEMAVAASNVVWSSSPVAVVVTEDSPRVSEAVAQAIKLRIPVFAVPKSSAAQPSPPDAAGVDPAPADVDPAPADAVSTAATPAASGASEASSGGTSVQGTASAGAVDVSAELARLGVGTVLVVGQLPAGSLPAVEQVTAVAQLPEFQQATPITATTAIDAPQTSTFDPVVTIGNLRAAGADALELANKDPRQRAADVTAIAASDAEHFIATGGGFGPVNRLATRLETAQTGVQLPGGGQTVFYDKRYVAIYGHPMTGGLGVLGEQGPAASVARVEKVAKPYRPLVDEQIIPAFEIIATVAAGDKGKDGNYSNEWDTEVLLPHIKAAVEHDVYVVLDLQPGRATLLEQAKRYADLLKEPQVGLAMDPEWKLTAKQKPMRQIGSVDVAEINDVLDWLADLTAQNDLPQKMVLLHQFRLDMITNREDLDLTHDELALVAQMDGDGTRTAKMATWNALLRDSPEGLRWGWKNFYDEDEPTATPEQTFRVRPKPWWVSYQ